MRFSKLFHTSLLMFVVAYLQLASSAFAQTATAVSFGKPQPPKQVEVVGFNSFTYWFAKKIVMDVDKKLAKQGIVADMCTFRQTAPPAEFSYKGLGPCLNKNFAASMHTENLAGSTYAWIKDRDNQYHAIEIQWRPPHGGWIKVIKQYFTMSSESAKAGKNSALPYDEFLGGDIKIILPNDSNIFEVLLEKAAPWIQNYLADVSSVSLHLKPTDMHDTKVIYTGEIVVEQKPTADGAVEKHQVDLRTDLNLAKLQRHFFLHPRNQNEEFSPDYPNEAKPKEVLQ